VPRWLLPILVSACGGSSSQPPEPDPPDRPDPRPIASDATAAAADAAPLADATIAAAHPDLSVTLDGKPIPIQSAIVVDETAGEVSIKLANFPHTCKEELASFRDTYPDEFQLRLRVGRYLHADGKLGWAIRGKYLSHAGSRHTQQTEKEHGGDPLPDIEIDPAAGASFELPLDFTWETPAKEQLVVKGIVQLRSCGENTKFSKEPPPTPLPGGGVLVIAGQELPLGGAGFIVNRSGEHVLELSTHPVKCVDGADYTTSRGDVELELVWNKSGTLYRAEREGRWVDWAANQTGDVGLTVTPKRPPRGAKQLKLKLGGKAEIAGYPVALAGTVTAIVCPTPK
jgi:hypothetical protein